MVKVLPESRDAALDALGALAFRGVMVEFFNLQSALVILGRQAKVAASSSIVVCLQ